ncbi:Homeobox protein HD-8 [Nosema granulosis]|uniref:Homeobox protein HD-8 n=1 Tax=Nosema granulosis TaxID=83296 RepID=A0A9P6KYG5_9MICR|nr:Homeobox protein HD-8 [Nosema granulosis]
MDEKEYDTVIGLLKLKSMNKSQTPHVKSKKTLKQKRILERVFQITSYPSSITQQDISIILNIPQRSVQIWFQNARHKLKNRTNKDELLDDNNEIPPSVLFKLVNDNKI